jgi:3-oxoacyl-[acyl-carrier protein] reductase
VVTGASQGIGRAIALRFAAEGANVVLCARGEQALAAVLTEIDSSGHRAIAVPVDVTQPAAAATVVDVARRHFGGVDILINNAGRATPAKLLDTSDDDWTEGLELNLLSAVRFTKACLPDMIDHHRGGIVNVSSVTARLADPLFAVYGAAKAALVNFTKTVAAAFAGDGIRCNAILPGIVATPLVQQNIAGAVQASGASPEEVMARMMRRQPIPAGRLGRPEEVADLVAFLASPAADWISGVALPIDGGTIPVAG